MIETPDWILTWVPLHNAPVILQLPVPDPIFIAAYGAHTVPSHFVALLDEEPLAILNEAVGSSSSPVPLPCTSVKILVAEPPFVILALTLQRFASPCIYMMKFPVDDPLKSNTKLLVLPEFLIDLKIYVPGPESVIVLFPLRDIFR